MWTLIVLFVGTLGLAWIASQITPALRLAVLRAGARARCCCSPPGAAARAGIVGLVAIVLSVIFVAHISNYTPQYKSDMREVGGQMSPLLHPGDLVVVAQPEQVPLAYYYLPGGLQFASTLGPVKDPTYMNWVYALRRLRNSKPAATLDPLLASLKPGQQLLYVRPLTEGAQNWQAPGLSSFAGARPSGERSSPRTSQLERGRRGAPSTTAARAASRTARSSRRRTDMADSDRDHHPRRRRAAPRSPPSTRSSCSAAAPPA